MAKRKSLADPTNEGASHAGNLKRKPLQPGLSQSSMVASNKELQFAVVRTNRCPRFTLN